MLPPGPQATLQAALWRISPPYQPALAGTRGPSSSLWLKAASRRDATVSRQQPVLPASGGWGPSGLEEGVWAQHPEDALHTA